MSEFLVAALMGTGTLLMVVAGVGVLRMPDALCRGHAVAKAVSLGIALILMGLWAHLGAKTDGLKLFLAIVFQLLTIPVASQLLARAVYQSGEPGPITKARSDKESGPSGPPESGSVPRPHGPGA